MSDQHMGATEPEIDNYFGPDREPYSLDEDTGYGTCYECGSYLENNGAYSDGDGDMYDDLFCPLCQESRGRANERWFDDEGNIYDDEDMTYAIGNIYGDELKLSLRFRIREFFAWLPIRVKLWDRNILFRFEPIFARLRRCQECGKRGVRLYGIRCEDCFNKSRRF